MVAEALDGVGAAVLYGSLRHCLNFPVSAILANADDEMMSESVVID